MAKASGPKRNQSLVLISWIAGFVIVAVAAMVGFSELGAHQQCDNSFQAIGAAIGRKKVSQKEITRYLDGSPARWMNKKNRHELFTWSGTLQSYSFQLDYDLYGNVERIKPR